MHILKTIEQTEQTWDIVPRQQPTSCKERLYVYVPEVTRMLRPLIDQLPQLLLVRIARRRDQRRVLHHEVEHLLPVPHVLSVLAVVVPHRVHLVALHLLLLFHGQVVEPLRRPLEPGPEFHRNPMIDHLEHAHTGRRSERRSGSIHRP